MFLNKNSEFLRVEENNVFYYTNNGVTEVLNLKPHWLKFNPLDYIPFILESDYDIIIKKKNNKWYDYENGKYSFSDPMDSLFSLLDSKIEMAEYINAGYYPFVCYVNTD